MSQAAGRSLILSDPMPLRLLRILVGAFYLPHVLSKVLGFSATVGFFQAAGFHPPAVFVVIAGVTELLVALALIVGVYTKYAALASAAVLFVAAYAICVVKGFSWAWNGGGIEYLVFWGIASLLLFLNEWRKKPGLFGLFQ